MTSTLLTKDCPRNSMRSDKSKNTQIDYETEAMMLQSRRKKSNSWQALLRKLKRKGKPNWSFLLSQQQGKLSLLSKDLRLLCLSLRSEVSKSTLLRGTSSKWLLEILVLTRTLMIPFKTTLLSYQSSLRKITQFKTLCCPQEGRCSFKMDLYPHLLRSLFDLSLKSVSGMRWHFTTRWSLSEKSSKGRFRGYKKRWDCGIFTTNRYKTIMLQASLNKRRNRTTMRMYCTSWVSLTRKWISDKLSSTRSWMIKSKRTNSNWRNIVTKRLCISESKAKS